jgi:ubiquinone/menaquinone biosynthesis C-methylase UbiE
MGMVMMRVPSTQALLSAIDDVQDYKLSMDERQLTRSTKIIGRLREGSEPTGRYHEVSNNSWHSGHTARDALAKCLKEQARQIPMPDTAPDSLPVGFRDVDATTSDKIIRCLDCLQSMAAGRAYKARALELLGLEPGRTVLDVACGLGDDVVRMQARGVRAVGADRSRTLIAAAQSRHAGSGCEFIVADGADLPFADGSFDALRIDRSLQHIADPGRVVREMARVARRGAVVLCAEPDWGTFLLGGTHTAVTERIQHDWIRTFQNPWIGRALPSLLADAGVGDLQQEALLT